MLRVRKRFFLAFAILSGCSQDSQKTVLRSTNGQDPSGSVASRAGGNSQGETRSSATGIKDLRLSYSSDSTRGLGLTASSSNCAKGWKKEESKCVFDGKITFELHGAFSQSFDPRVGEDYKPSLMIFSSLEPPPPYPKVCEERAERERVRRGSQAPIEDDQDLPCPEYTPPPPSDGPYYLDIKSEADLTKVCRTVGGKNWYAGNRGCSFKLEMSKMPDKARLALCEGESSQSCNLDFDSWISEDKRAQKEDELLRIKGSEGVTVGYFSLRVSSSGGSCEKLPKGWKNDQDDCVYEAPSMFFYANWENKKRVGQFYAFVCALQDDDFATLIGDGEDRTCRHGLGKVDQIKEKLREEVGLRKEKFSDDFK